MVKIALYGYDTVSGWGILNRQLVKHLRIPKYRWVRPRHRYFESLSGTPTIADAVKTANTLLFAETAPRSLLHSEKKRGNRIVCIPMQEWLDVNTLRPFVDLFVCPTTYCYSQCLQLRLPCVLFPWPTDLYSNANRPKTVCRRFLFIEGHGGWHNRKGADVVHAMLAKEPSIPLVVYSQQNNETEWDRYPNVIYKGEATSPSALYSRGDVLLYPHRTDGIGLEALETLAHGIPLIVTKGAPWQDYPAIARIEAQEMWIHTNHDTAWWEPSPDSLLACCKRVLYRSILEESKEALAFAKYRQWKYCKSYLKNLIQGA